MQIFDTRGGASMLQQQRHDIILSILAENGTVHTADLVKRMDVSSETIRKGVENLHGYLKMIITQKKDLKRGNAKKHKKKYGVFCD